jgi:hypothetical protein
VAVSIEASKFWGGDIVLDPNSTLQNGTKVPDYIAMLNTRKYLDFWTSSPIIGSTPALRYVFSNISIQQIPNNGNAKNAIRAAIDNNQAVVFTYKYYSSYAYNLFENDFWKYKDEDVIFYGINASSPSGNRMQEDRAGHVMCIIGYDDTDQSFIVQNSWGTPY